MDGAVRTSCGVTVSCGGSAAAICMRAGRAVPPHGCATGRCIWSWSSTRVTSSTSCSVLARGGPPDSVDAAVAWRETERAWRARVPSLEHTAASRDARHACAVLRRATAARRDGRRGDDGAAGAGARGPQLRLPLRLDPGPVLRRAGGRAAAPAHCWTAPSTSSATGCSPTGRGWRRPTPSRRSRARRAHARPARLPRRQRRVGNWVNGQFQLDAFGEALLLFAAADQHGRLRSRRLARRDGGGRCDRASPARARRRHLGARAAALDAQPADLCRRPPRHRRAARRRQAAEWLGAGRALTAEAAADG